MDASSFDIFTTSLTYKKTSRVSKVLKIMLKRYALLHLMDAHPFNKFDFSSMYNFLILQQNVIKQGRNNAKHLRFIQKYHMFTSVVYLNDLFPTELEVRDGMVELLTLRLIKHNL